MEEVMVDVSQEALCVGPPSEYLIPQPVIRYHFKLEDHHDSLGAPFFNLCFPNHLLQAILELLSFSSCLGVSEGAEDNVLRFHETELCVIICPEQLSHVKGRFTALLETWNPSCSRLYMNESREKPINKATVPPWQGEHVLFSPLVPL
jgi:hypothetical protein